LVPIVAAIAGVVIPAVLYLLTNPLAPASFGWSIPTATDIAFVLGLLAVFGRGLPPAARVFLLALAIFDDVIAILIITFQFTDDLQLEWLALSVMAALVLRASYIKAPIKFRPFVLGAAFCVAWYGMHSSGIHATLAGVIIGLAIPAKQTHRVLNKMQPISNLIILPVFALFAVSIQMPASFDGGGAVFVGIALALPLGKLFGISVAGYVANRFAPAESRLGLTYLDFSVVGALAGVGFTVSLLLSKLAFEDYPQLQAEAIFGVLVGSSLAIVLTVMLTQLRRMSRKTKRALREN
jgi:NhaA family Na+:H+ antiporter